jgi:hypothetical protein
MNKQQITNYIANKLNSLLSDEPQPPDAQVQIRLLAAILRDITRDDDYSFSGNQVTTSIPTSSFYSGTAELGNAVAGLNSHSSR